MTVTAIRLLSFSVIATALFFIQSARATLVNFTVDTTGGATGLTPLANTAANTGKYAAGSWVTLGGSISVTDFGITASGNFANESGAGASGSFSTGNPGSLDSYYHGNLLANIDSVGNTISFPAGSTLNAGIYNAHYPEVAAAGVPLTPQIGGGIAGTPGSDLANYGVALSLNAFGFITAASGTGALRDTVLDIGQSIGITNQAFTGAAGNQTFATNGNVAVGLVTGNLDYNFIGQNVLGNQVPDFIGAAPIGSTTFTSMTGSVGTLTTTLLGGGLERLMLTVPVKTTIVEMIAGTTPVTVTLTLTGQIAAYATVPVPEPSSWALLALGGCALMPGGLRRRLANRTRGI